MPLEDASLRVLVETAQDCFNAHTAALFLPLSAVDVCLIPSCREGSLYLAAYSSLSQCIVDGAVMEPGQGLVGWVYKEDRFLHATDFRNDTRTLGFYSQDVDIKAFMASPIPNGFGVLMVDSRLEYAFPEKKQAEFKQVARLSEVVIKAFLKERERGFMKRFFMDFRAFSSGSLNKILQALMRITGLGNGVAFSVEKDFMSLQASAPSGITRMKRDVLLEAKELACLSMKHNAPILTHRLSGLRTCIGPTILAFCTRGTLGPIAWVLWGGDNLWGFPKVLLEVVSHVICHEEMGDD